jgi:ribosomal protein S18 acetylase RimI-like enzyme/predicted nucleic acid-binding protein
VIMAEQYFLRRNLTDILPFLESVRTQADSERNALGFLPEAAYAEAAQQRKLILLLSQDEGTLAYVGHLLFGGMFPILRVRQIAVAAAYRRRGHATTLLRALIAQAEAEGYLNIVANVAADLNRANAFYERSGFLSAKVKAGGKTRNRTINVRILQLETPSLISYMLGSAQPKVIEILQPIRRSLGVPVYAIDLNVFFDAIKKRARSQDAGVVFEAALNHQIRIAASEEFVSELRRTSNDATNDPVLALARRIPVLPPREKTEIESLAPIISGLVFPERTAQLGLKSTDKSDVLHLAHAVAAGAAGYITSDEKILSARDALMKQFKLDVIGLSEFVDLLDLPGPPSSSRENCIRKASEGDCNCRLSAPICAGRRWADRRCTAQAFKRS